jgi:hypothetical protein
MGQLSALRMAAPTTAVEFGPASVIVPKNMSSMNGASRTDQRPRTRSDSGASTFTSAAYVSGLYGHCVTILPLLVLK